MKKVFFVKSNTVNLNNYNIKDIPGSSGRLDVISRVILAALFSNHELERNTQIWVFLDNYGTYIFDSEKISVENFPMTEILLTDHFVKYIQKKENVLLNSVDYLKTDIFQSIDFFHKKKYKTYILNENGENFQKHLSNINQHDNLLFIIGDQSGDLIDSEQLINRNLINISFGKQLYLASSTIRLIKLNLGLLVG
jgi:tRNA (pseudouridine54-N1)-methyltransferase